MQFRRAQEARIKPRMPQATQIQPRVDQGAGFKSRGAKELRIQAKRPQYPYRRTLELDRGVPRWTPRKNNALRKKRTEGYMAKKNRYKGALLRKSMIDPSLSPKGCMDKAMKKRQNIAKPV